MIKRIPIDPYPKKLFLVIAEKDADVMHFFHKEEDDYKAIYRLSPNDEALTIRTPKGNTVIRFGKKPEAPGLITHEAFHATHSILDYVGITLTDSSEEAFAYMLDFITTEIHKACGEI